MTNIAEHPMLQSLHSYYVANGICPGNFTCPHQTECREGQEKFCEAREPVVGVHYLDRKIPRLLFISLDPGSLDEPPERRELRVCATPPDSSGWHKSRHWYQTHELAVHLLLAFDPSIGIETSAMHFAHTNTVRCCVNKERSAQAGKTLYKNCRGYLGEEVRLLEPDIIVTQGGEARDALGDSLKASEVETGPGEAPLKILHLGVPESSLWYHSHHPSSFGHYRQQQREEWSKLEAPVSEFFAGWTSDSRESL